MKKTGALYAVLGAVLGAMLLLTGASVWEGAAVAAGPGELPDDGFYVATNSFPANTIVDLTNLETGKTLRVIVAKGLDTPGLLAVLSAGAAEAIGLKSRALGRIRMSMPADPIAFSRFTEGIASSGDPDHDPKAAVAGALPEIPAPEAPLAETPLTEMPRTEESPTQTPTTTLVAVEPVVSGEAPAREDVPAAGEIVDVPESYVPPVIPDSPDISVQPQPVPTAIVAVEGVPPLDIVVEPELPAVEKAPAEATAPESAPASVAPVPMEEPLVAVAPPTPEPPAPSAPEAVTATIAAEEAPPALVEAEPAPPVAPEPPAAPEAVAATMVAAEADPALAEAEPAAEPVPPVEPVPEPPAAVAEPETPVAVETEVSLVPAEERPPEPEPEHLPIIEMPEEAVAAMEPEIAPAVEEPVAAIPPPPAELAVATQPVVEAVPPGAPQKLSLPVVSRLEKGKYYLQLGAYSKAAAVEALVKELGSTYPLTIQEAGSPEKPLYRILVGPVNLGESGALLQRFKLGGYRDVFIRQEG